MPRPTKLTEQLIDDIAHGVQRGARPELVAQALGVGRSTYYGWIERGRQPGPGDHLHVELLERIEQARGLARLYLIDKIARSGDWRAAAKLLEILDPDWARAAGMQVDDRTGERSTPTIRIVVETKKSVGDVASGEEPTAATTPMTNEEDSSA